MVYSSNNDFDEELPDMQLLLEQEVAKSKRERIALPPSLFDPITPPKSKSKSKSQSTKADLTTKLKTVGKKRVVAETLGDSSAPKEVKAKKDTMMKKQIPKAVTEKTTKATVKKAESGVVKTSRSAVSSSVPSDHSGLSIFNCSSSGGVYTSNAFRIANSISWYLKITLTPPKMRRKEYSLLHKDGEDWFRRSI